ncbi:MAG TPA: FkbM family methyltransferase [Flavobacteriales bacterium]
MDRFGIWHGALLGLRFLSGNLTGIRLPHQRVAFSLRKNTSDIATFYQVFLLDEYDIAMAEQPRTIIDGGANIGLFSVQYKDRFPEARIICIEPDPENFELLKSNTAPLHDVLLEHSGLWHRDSRLTIHDKHDLGKWGMTVEEDERNGNIEAICMDSLMKKHAIDRIDILKLDVEGSERHIFSQNYEQWLPKVKMIIIELHDRMEKGCASTLFTAINRTFKNYSFHQRGENTIIINEDL